MAVTEDNFSDDSENSLVGKSSSDKKDTTKKKEFVFYKYSKGPYLAEAIFINNRPMFLQIQNGKVVLSKTIDLDDHLIVPPDKSSYLSKEYVFSSKEEVEQYKKRAQQESLDSIYKKAKGIWSKYFENNQESLTLCPADTIFTYFQDKMGMTHYLLFVGDNGSGKSNALRVFHHLGYRPLFEVDTTPANIYNFLGQFEEGQGIILEDELDNIEEDEDKMKIYKSGYVSGAQVTRMYDTNTNAGKNNTATKRQQKYNTFCFKAFSAERQPNDKAKGFSERIFPIKCKPGTPSYDISEITNDAGDAEHRKLYREIEDLRKLLLVYRILHYDDQIPDIELSIKNRDKQLCKPLIRLFNNTKAQQEIVASLSKFLAEKHNKKLDSFDAYLYSVVSDLVKEEITRVSNDELWSTIRSLPASDVPNKPFSCQTEDFGIISRTRVTKTCEDKFGAVKGHDGQQRYLVFNKATIQALKTNYSPIEEIKIIDNHATTNTSNTFNTFWKGVERNGSSRNKLKNSEISRSVEESGFQEEDTERSTASTSITVNVNPMSKEEDTEYPTETNNTSIH